MIARKVADLSLALGSENSENALDSMRARVFFYCTDGIRVVKIAVNPFGIFQAAFAIRLADIILVRNSGNFSSFLINVAFFRSPPPSHNLVTFQAMKS